VAGREADLRVAVRESLPTLEMLKARLLGRRETAMDAQEVGFVVATLRAALAATGEKP
jgi:hypothetical protein